MLVRRSVPFWMTLGALALAATPAQAQTWTGGRSTPVISELVVIDATGESGWPFGFEDLAGDGADFGQQEQSIDIRTAYAVADNQTLWARTYVSDDNAAGGNIVVFVFIDADDDPSSGGGADASEIHALFTDDPTPGGYEFVIEIGGNAMINDIWEWDGSAFAPITLMPNDNADAEAGQDDRRHRPSRDQHAPQQGPRRVGPPLPHLPRRLRRSPPRRGLRPRRARDRRHHRRSPRKEPPRGIRRRAGVTPSRSRATGHSPHPPCRSVGYAAAARRPTPHPS